MGLPAAFQRYRAAIDAELRAALAGYRLPLYDMLRYHLGWLDEWGNPRSEPAGKALRPTLCLLACEALAADHRPALPAAAALELMHNYSLIHDDIQDDDRERRHRPTVWCLWGKPQAINAGTAMWVVANLALHRLAEGGLPSGKQVRALRLLNEACLRLLEGQYLDISFEGRLDVTVAEYLLMIEGKTATLIACSLQLGALIGSDDECAIHAFRALGRDLGLAFQIRDDLLGIWGDTAVTGKPVGADIRRRKKTLPIVYALEQAPAPAQAELRALYQGGPVDDRGLAMVLGILAETGTQARTQAMAEAYSAQALAHLAAMALPPWAQAGLEEMIQFLARREF